MLSSDGPPDKSKRQRCWTARDAYFKCLDDNGLWLNGYKPVEYEEILSMDPTRPQMKLPNDRSLTKEQKKSLFVCQKAMEFFKSECLPSWVSCSSLAPFRVFQSVSKRATGGVSLRAFAAVQHKHLSVCITHIISLSFCLKLY